MPTITQMQGATMPVKVLLGSNITITLDVFTERSTMEDKREISRLMKQTNDALEAKSDAAAELRDERKKLLKPTTEIAQQAVLLREQVEKTSDTQERLKLQADIDDLTEKFTAARKKVEKQVTELDERIEALDMEGEEAVHNVRAQELAFFVAGTDITEEDGSEIPASYDFFRSRCSFTMLEKSLNAVREARTGPLVTPSNIGTS